MSVYTFVHIMDVKVFTVADAIICKYYYALTHPSIHSWVVKKQVETKMESMVAGMEVVVNNMGAFATAPATVTNDCFF